jgi:Uma2 family endonuclease
MATTLELLSAEEYARLPDSSRPTELVRGRVVEMNLPGTQHGKICNQIGRFIGNFVAERDLGNVINNDSGVITKRNPDSVRGPDVSFYSYARWPKGPIPNGYLPVVPELVVEVLSPDDRWSDVHEKIAEYLTAGVSVVCIVDPKTKSAHLYYPDRPERALASSEDLTVPEILGDFRVPVSKLFE